MLLGLLLGWIVNKDARRLPTMNSSAHIAYISHIGATNLQPLFIAGCIITAVFLDLSFLSERWLRHQGRLVPNTSLSQKVISGLSILCALVGTVGLICLSIFKTGTYTQQHNIFLCLFIGGYLFSAFFICWEYQRLGISLSFLSSPSLLEPCTDRFPPFVEYKEHRMLRASFWVKLVFILVEIALLICFGVLGRLKKRDAAAVFEWIVSFVFTFYVLSFVIDLYPAVRTKSPDARFTKPIPSALSASSDPRDTDGSPHNAYGNYHRRNDVEMQRTGRITPSNF